MQPKAEPDILFEFQTFEPLEPPSDLDFGKISEGLNQALEALIGSFLIAPANDAITPIVPAITSPEMARATVHSLRTLANQIESQLTTSVPMHVLQEDFNPDDDEPPTEAARARASALVAEANGVGLHVDEVDSDVLGGMGLLFFGSKELADRRAWVACMNDGRTSYVLTDEDGNVFGINAGESPWERIKQFLGRE